MIKRQIVKILKTFIIFMTILILHGCSSGNEQIIISGSTTISPLIQEVSKISKANIKVNVITTSNGSITGLNDLINKKCDISASSVKIPEDIEALALERGVKIREKVFATDLIVCIVNRKNPINNLSLAELKAIFSGAKQNWSDFGGNKKSIDVVCRNRFSGTKEIWDTKVIGGSPSLANRFIIKSSNSGILAYVESNPDAIGYISFEFINTEIKVLKINNVKPSIENGIHGHYPIYRSLYFYIDENRFTPAIKKFLIFMMSDAGREIIKKAGLIPSGAIIN